jgi:fumarate reductase subunit D
MARRSIEPLLWLMFSGGGVLAALGLPILLLMFGVAFPLGWLTPPDHDQLTSLMRPAIVRVALFILCALSLVHAGHRFRFTLYDGIQIKHLNELIGLLCYGGALVGSVAAGYLLWRVG